MIFYDDILLPNSTIDEETFYDMIEYVLATMEQFVKEYPESISQANFEEILKTNIKCMFDIQYFPETNSKISFTTYEELIDSYDSIFDIIYKYCQLIFHKTIIPRRSYTNTFIRVKPNIELIKNKLNYLVNTPQPIQRSNEWYKYRHELITASNAWKVFESIRTQNQLICEKCKPLNLNLDDNQNKKFVQMDSPLHWGNKYEDVSIMIYEHFNKTAIDDFGCIQHPNVPCLGASPDGICNDSNSDIYGRMLEIKNVVSRQINGIPKKEYWIQMQLQMEVCNLNECDFLETKFLEYENEEEFINNDGFQQHIESENHNIKFHDFKDYNGIKGIMMCFIENSKPVYYYAPLFIDYTNFVMWSENLLALQEDLGNIYFKTIYWQLDFISCVLVLRNKLWFQKALPKINNIWNIIKNERVHGYEHRLPKPKKSKQETTNIEQHLLDPSLLDELNESCSLITTTTNSSLLNPEFCQSSVNGIYNYTRSRSSTIVSDCDN